MRKTIILILLLIGLLISGCSNNSTISSENSKTEEYDGYGEEVDLIYDDIQLTFQTIAENYNNPTVSYNNLKYEINGYGGVGSQNSEIVAKRYIYFLKVSAKGEPKDDFYSEDISMLISGIYDEENNRCSYGIIKGNGDNLLLEDKIETILELVCQKEGIQEFKIVVEDSTNEFLAEKKVISLKTTKPTQEIDEIIKKINLAVQDFKNSNKDEIEKSNSIGDKKSQLDKLNSDIENGKTPNFEEFISGEELSQLKKELNEKSTNEIIWIASSIEKEYNLTFLTLYNDNSLLSDSKTSYYSIEDTLDLIKKENKFDYVIVLVYDYSKDELLEMGDNLPEPVLSSYEFVAE
ncbi:MAG: hypothetical protein KC589_03825 [Nanoarchaeota archaeon]|nr:hypothetical protein [Nanoarchaeota archaeon]